MPIDEKMIGRAITALPLDKIIGQPIVVYQDALISAKVRVEQVKKNMYYNEDGSQKEVVLRNIQRTTNEKGEAVERDVELHIPKYVDDGDGEGWEQVGGGQEVEFRIETSQSYNTESSKEGKGSLEVSVKAGWGPVSIGSKMQASFSASSKSSTASSIKSIWDIKQRIEPKKNTVRKDAILDKMLAFCEPFVVNERVIEVKPTPPEVSADKNNTK